MDWKGIDGRFVKRGELLLSLDFLEDYEGEFRALNGAKVGRPFKLIEGC
jgi:hypothetical protein